jgi:hypothetical protein
MAKFEYPYQNLSLVNMKGERWKDIPNLEGYFKISNYGRVKRLEYKLESIAGVVRIMPEKIKMPVLQKLPNSFMNDNIFVLCVQFILFKRRYSFTVARMVYNCFKAPINLSDRSFVILTKDSNGKNIKPSNLIKSTISEKQKRIYLLNRIGPLVLDEEVKKRQKAAVKRYFKKQITQYNLQGKKIRTYSSVSSASKRTKISSPNIRHSVNSKGLFKAGGFLWQFGNTIEMDITPMLDKIAMNRIDHKENFGKKVSQYAFSGHRISVYVTKMDAQKATGVFVASISKVLRKITQSAGEFYWLEGEGPTFIDLSGKVFGKALWIKNKLHAVYQYSENGELIKQFASLIEAAKLTGVYEKKIRAALKGNAETAGGYRWKYIDKLH